MIGQSNRERGLAVVSEMLVSSSAEVFAGAHESTEFAGFVRDIALRNLFGEIWARPALDRRSRSLLTLGIVIALQTPDEVGNHAVMAIRNGVKLAELEEIIYHVSAYVGFPATNVARGAMMAALDAAGLLKAK
jgi:4-carboxymuconolactone decarboxylase